MLYTYYTFGPRQLILWNDARKLIGRTLGLTGESKPSTRQDHEAWASLGSCGFHL